jgi:serine/threonine protein kinase
MLERNQCESKKFQRKYLESVFFSRIMLKHDNVINYFHHFPSEKGIIIVMELVEGGNLSHLIKNQIIQNQCFPDNSF